MDYWDAVLKDLPDSYCTWFKEERTYLQKVVTPHARVLEIGCGDGRSILDLTPITKHVTGIDHDDGAIRSAQHTFANEPTIHILKVDASQLPFENETFDFVICMTTFANFADKKYMILEEMKRVLTANGKIIISVFSEDAFPERMALYKKLGVKIKEIRGTTVVFDESVGDNISEQFTQEQLRDIFSQASLNVDDITRVSIAYLCTISKS